MVDDEHRCPVSAGKPESAKLEAARMAHDTRRRSCASLLLLLAAAAASSSTPPSLSRGGSPLLLLAHAAAAALASSASSPDAPEHLDLDDMTVTLGGAHACALERVDDLSIGGEIVCWGNAAHGQLNPPAGMFVQLSASEHTTCAVGIDERVACWGGDAGITGPPSGTPGRDAGAAAAAAALASSPLLQVTVGGRHACALRSSSGRAVCWGDDSHGQVSGAPGEVAFVQLSCGGDACCGLVRDGSGGGGGGGGDGHPPGFALRCWGCTAGGLLRAPAGPFLQVSVAGDHHACAVRSDYRLVCWGAFVSPTGGEVAWNGTFLQVAAAEGVSCALRGDGTLFCVGERSRLWSGRPVRGSRDLPLPLPPPPPITTQFAEVSAHGINVCGVTAGSARRVFCWGETRDVYYVPRDLEPAGAIAHGGGWEDEERWTGEEGEL